MIDGSFELERKELWIQKNKAREQRSTRTETIELDLFYYTGVLHFISKTGTQSINLHNIGPTFARS